MQDETITCTRHASPLGPMLLAATPRGLRGVWFEGQRHGPVDVDWPQDADHPRRDGQRGRELTLR